MKTGVIIALVICCILVTLGTVLGVYFSGVACPDFGSKCTQSPSPGSNSPSPAAPSPAAPSPAAPSPDSRTPGVASIVGSTLTPAAGKYLGSCTIDSNCTEPGQICCMGKCGDASYCDSKCGGGDMVFYNGNKTCMSIYDVRALSQTPKRNYTIGTACTNNNDCDSGFCNAWKNGGVCSVPQASVGQACEAWYDCDQSDALDCRGGRCIRPYSD